MRRPSRARFRPPPPPRGRAVLALEELEAREVLSPVVVPPTFLDPPPVPEGSFVVFAGGPFSGGSSFAAFDIADAGQPYDADLIALNGVVDVDESLAGSLGLTVAGDGTPLVRLSGTLSSINGLLAAGYVFAPAPFYSGDAALTLRVNDPAVNDPGQGSHPIHVLPVAQPPTGSLNFPPLSFAGPGPVVIPPSAVVIDPWADTDGSETVSVAFDLPGPLDPNQFTFTAGGAVIPADVDGIWLVTAPDFAALRALLDDLTLAPPAGFSGPFDLRATVFAEDVVTFAFPYGPAGDLAPGGTTIAQVRYFTGGVDLQLRPATGAENQPVPISGAIDLYSVDDDLPGDTYELTLTAPAGAFFADTGSSNFGGTVAGAGTNTITFGGDLLDIYDAIYFLPIEYDAPAGFAGELPLTLSLQGFRPDPGSPIGATAYPAPVVLAAPIRVLPVASFPTVFEQFEIPPTVPVGPGASPIPAGLFDVSPTPDADGSEVTEIVVEVVGGPTPGFVLTAGGLTVPRQPDGTWVLSAPDAIQLQLLLDALTLTPAGGLTGGGYSLAYTARVTDTAFFPSDESTATDVRSRSLIPVPLLLSAGPSALVGVEIDPVVIDEGQLGGLGGGTVRVIDPDGGPLDNYVVTLNLDTPGATFVVPGGPPPGVSVSGAGTATLTVYGGLAAVTNFFNQIGSLAFVAPSPFFSGLVAARGSVVVLRDEGGGRGGPPGPPSQPQPQPGDFAASVTHVVQPWVSTPVVLGPGPGGAFAPVTGFALSGFVFVPPWPDGDGSEAGRVTFALGGVPSPAGFVLTENGAPLMPVAPGVWEIAAASPSELQARLDALTLRPPPGFAGRVILNATLTLTDAAPGVPPPFRSVAVASGAAAGAVRFFIGGANVGPPLLTGNEGEVLALGGALTVRDPDALPGDTHELTLTVPTGAFVVNPGFAGPNTMLTVIDAQTIVLAGPLPELAGFLGAPGSLAFDPQDSDFNGVVPLGYSLLNTLFIGPTFFTPPGGSGTVFLAIGPVASELTPVVADATTDVGVPVALAVAVPGLATLGERESVTIQFLGLPPGAALSAGTDAGGGTWELTEADFAGLTFTPPPGFAGVIRLTVLVTVTEFVPELETTSTAIGLAALNVNVLGSTPPPPGPGPTPPDGGPTPPPPPPGGGGPTPPPPGGPVVGPRRFDPSPPPSGTDPGPQLPLLDDGPTDPFDRPAVIGGPRVEVEVEPLVEVEADGTPDPEPTPHRVEALHATSFQQAGVGPGPGPAERREAGVPVAGSLFARAELPAPPLAAMVDRHPLPPVLPLDQSAPVAGFTESGGDSIALIEALYRDAAAPPVTIPVVYEPVAPARADDRAAQASIPAPPAGPTALAGDGDAPPPAGWTFDWLAAGLGFFAAAWFVRGRAAARWFARRLPGPLARLFPPTQEPV